MVAPIAGDNLSVQWTSKVNPWLIALSVMLATFMEVLDTSVANVSLNHIAGNLSASRDEATWILTSYLVSNTVILPVSGWLGRFFGRKRFLITCISLFTIASALCGMAQSLGFLIIGRILQGMGGGALQPISQAVLLESFSKEKRGSAMSVYAIGVIVAPIFGPTLGGWLTDNYSWRWVFYINLPIGILAAFFCHLFLEDPPYLKETNAGKIDFVGFGFLAIWIGCLQVFLDKGQDDDWFSSKFICWLTAFTIIGFVFFLIWELKVLNPIVNLRLLKDQNLAIGSVLLFLIGAVLYSSMAILPQFLQTLLSYPSLQSGLVMSPRGIGAIIGSIVSGKIIANLKIDGRVWIAGGFVVLGITMGVFGGVTLAIAPENIIPAIIISGFGITCIFVPMTTFSIATVSRENMGDATGLTSLLRNLGGSVGISLVTAFVTRGSQVHQVSMVRHMSPFNPTFNDRLATMQNSLARQVGTANAHDQPYAMMYQTLQTQARFWSYVDQFHLLLIICFICVPLVFLFKKEKKPLLMDAPSAH